jgi:hypothetical protein
MAVPPWSVLGVGQVPRSVGVDDRVSGAEAPRVPPPLWSRERLG